LSAPPVRVADAGALREGDGVRFKVMLDGISWNAFAVRWRGVARAWVNACRHEGLTLDFGDGRFFDESADALVCVHHGARYRPDTGRCAGGPCEGGSLTPLALEEREGVLWCTGRAPRPAGRERPLSGGAS
jgi:nitrite reductase/ring-hydroxylating ferredoxin subunit